MSRDKQPSITTPFGRAIWPCLDKPSTRFNADGVYETKLALEPSERRDALEQRIRDFVEEFMEETRAELQEKGGKHAATAKKLSMRLPFEPEYDEEGEETGTLIFKFKRNAKVTSKKTGKTYTFSVKVFDTKNRSMKGVPVGNGSIVRVIAGLRPYFIPKDAEVGVTLDLNQVQVRELETYSEGAASGFDELEDGYEFDEADVSVDREDDGSVVSGGDEDDIDDVSDF